MVTNTGVVEERVKELVWWEEVEVEGENNTTFTVASTPSNHWCKRGLADKNLMLWSSWAVVGPSRCCSHIS